MAKTTKNEPTLDQLRALVARMEAEAVAASDLDPTAAFCAELDDHRVDPRALAAFARRVVKAFDTLGVDIHAEAEAVDELDDTDADVDAPADELEADAVTAKTSPARAKPKGGK